MSWSLIRGVRFTLYIVGMNGFGSHVNRRSSLAGECARSHLRLTLMNLELRRLATAQELSNPVSFVLENSWTTTLKSDKQYFLEQADNTGSNTQRK